MAHPGGCTVCSGCFIILDMLIAEGLKSGDTCGTCGCKVGLHRNPFVPTTTTSQDNGRIEKLEQLVLKMTINSQGARSVTAEADWVSDLRSKNYLKVVHSGADSFAARLLNDIAVKEYGWFEAGSIWTHVPQASAPEKDKDNIKGTQSYLKNINEKIRNATHLYQKSKVRPTEFINVKKPFTKTSTPMDRYNSRSFETRKPDDVFYSITGVVGQNGITCFGDAKPFDGDVNSPFTEAQIGHILDMGVVFMQLVQPWRRSLIVFLTDCRRFQFFEIIRTSEYFDIADTGVYADADGWSIYLGLLSCDKAQLGFVDMTIDDANLVDLIGVGKKYVFSGKLENETGTYVFKIFPTSYNSGYDKEFSNLQAISSISHKELVPEFIRSLQTKESAYSVLVLSPLSSPVNPCKNGVSVKVRHILQLVEVLNEVHTVLNLAHRDIKPENIFIQSNDNVLLNDWGSAATIGNRTQVEGTYGFCDELLTFSEHEPTIQADRKALVRSSYLMLYNHPPPLRGEVGDRVQNFWDDKFGGTVWSDVSDGEAELGEFFEKMLFYK